MNIPNKVRIGSMDYIVELTDETLYVGNTICLGTIEYDKHTIKINKNLQDLQGMKRTFLHELVHGIVNERSLDLQNPDEEIIVDEIAMGLHQVIRDNSEIFKEGMI